MAAVATICILLALSVEAVDRSPQCVNIKKCRCVTDKDKPEYFKMACRGASSRELINLKMPRNTTDLEIRHTARLNATVLRRMANNSENIRNIIIGSCNIIQGHFSWAWLPDSTTMLRLWRTNIMDLYAKEILHENGTTEYQCNMSHLTEIQQLTMFSPNQRKVPACMPSTITRLTLQNVDLNYLGKSTKDVIKWPKSLKYLHFTDNNITHLWNGIFPAYLSNLAWIIMKNQPITDGGILLNLPARTLYHLNIQNTSISKVNADHLKNFRRYSLLTWLGITYSKLEEVPNGMPGSIQHLYLNNNKIRYLDSSALSELKTLKLLNMMRNLLMFVPAGLPDALQQIQFDHNQIAFCDEEAFSGMTGLKLLVLTNNSLRFMPVNIPSSLEYYSLEGNAISDIGSESNYNFCENCRLFNIENNPWACNKNMMTFLVWMSKHRSHLISIGISKNKKNARCGSGALQGLNNVLVEEIVKYIRFYAQIGCFYDAETLNCTGSGLESLPKLSRTIESLYIKNNPAIGNVKPFVLASLKDLKNLTLQNIGLTRIPQGLPRTVVRLCLAHNDLAKITDADAEALKSLVNVQTIDLSYNKLKSLPLMRVKPFSKLTMVILKGNPLNCNCEIWPYATWAYQKKQTSKESAPEDALRGECARPLSKKGTYITEILDYLTNHSKCMPAMCQWDEETPVINCSYSTQRSKSAGQHFKLHKIPAMQRNGYWRMIDLSGLQLKSSDVNLTHLYNLKNVKLSNNSLSTIPWKGLPNTVVNLFVDGNNISYLPRTADIKTDFKNLQCLDLQNNNIRSLSEREVTLFRLLKEMKLHGNPLLCDCKLRPLSTWISANYNNPQMKRHALQRLECHGPKQLERRLMANLTEAEYCPAMKIGAIIGGLAGGVAVMIIIFIGSLSYWQRQIEIREREDILRGFRELLQQEAEYQDEDPETGIVETDKFRYDAFLSYSPHDEDAEFASEILDQLEIRHGYKLCVHERDFVPGVSIADNIVESIGASRRIILLVSHSFVESPWCQYEIQVALTELHQKRKSKLLIPILLEDLDGRVEGSVKTFLSLIKGLKIPGNRSQSSWEGFWNEILEAMPEPPVVDDKV